MSIYTPNNCKPLSESKVEQQIRLGIQGYPGTGKTWAALTFPNPVVANLDRGLAAHDKRADVIEVPLYNPQWIRETMRLPAYHPSGLKDICIKWLETEATKLTPEQTLVWDGNTGLQNAYHKWYEANQTLFLTKQGNVNEFAEWTVKKKFFSEIMEIFKSLSCHVVYCCHEIDMKDKNGVNGPLYSGKIRPLLTGAFGDEIEGHFNNWFRAHAADKPADFTSLKADSVMKMWGMTIDEFRKFCDTFPRGTIYYWQTESDSVFDAKCSLVNFPRYVPARYETFSKYKRIS